MIHATALKTECLRSPLGIDIVSPRLSWKVENAVKQTAYQLRASENDGGWEELPPVKTDSMAANLGRRYTSRDSVRWQVRLTDQEGHTGEWSECASFEIGLLEKAGWSAKWIMGSYEHSPSGKERYPADCFRREFAIDGEVVKARLYITACGIYETALNGKRVGNQVLTPGSTAFQKRVHYQTYDVTGLLETRNVWDIELADGYYASNTGVFDNPKPYGHEPKVLAQLETTKADGSVQTIVTDSGFRWSNDGSVRYADLKNGEIVDFSFAPTYSGYALETDYTGIICCSNSDPIHEKERLARPAVIRCPNGQTVLDFGQNIAGYMEVTVCGPKGHKRSMTFGEKLKENGNFTVANIAWKAEYDTSHFQTNELICNGDTVSYKSRFTVMGFLYVLLRDWPEEVKPENFTAIAVYSDMDVTFAFDSSDNGLNQIVKNTFWSVKGNFLDVPTDCPTRERAGWTGDAQLFFNTGNYMMDQRAFFRKWLRNCADCQKENGLVYNVNPSNPHNPAIIEWLSVEGSAGWGDAMIIIPYYCWKRYGDDCLIREFWEPMLRCHSFYKRRMGRRNLLSLFRPKRMCKLVRPCGLNLAEGQARAKLLDKIVKLNRKRDYKIGAGFLTTPFVFEMLSEAGESDDAYRTLTNPEIGWMQQINQGATTVWENWTPDASLNHYSKGDCCQWLFDCICGIKLDGRENHFIIGPHTISQVSHVSFTYDSAYGTVSSGWRKEGNGYVFCINIPANCTADVCLPGQKPQMLPAGNYEFKNN